MTVVEHFVTSDAVIGNILHVDFATFTSSNHSRAKFGHISTDDNSTHTLEGFRFAFVDRDNTGVRMRATQHRSVEHTWQVDIITKQGSAGNFLFAIFPDRRSADHIKFSFYGWGGCWRIHD